MRVADQQVYGTLLGNLQRSRQQLLQAQQQISSQKKVTQPSDDPAAFGQIVLDKSSLSQTDQWIRNIQFGTARIEAADSALGQVQNLLTRLRELTIQARSDTTSAQGRTTIAQEVRQLHRQLVQLANTEVGGQAVFGGTETNVTPFVITSGDSVAYQGNTESRSIAVGRNQTAQVLIPGNESFTGATTNLFDSVSDLLTALESNNGTGIETAIGNLDLATSQISDAQGKIGALANRLDVTKTALDVTTTTIRQALSNNQDADLAAAITQLSLQQVAVEATSQAFSKIFETSLLKILQ
ncbi:MAG TPA: flagellar hook-associated protein FlgL [Nitrospiraceae bacterium]|nr:flagellar hook-associated protein FlgL [Nitrospiraceae bacterium]